MKMSPLKMTSVLLAGSIGMWCTLPAQEVVAAAPAETTTTTTTTTTSNGTFTEFTPTSETFTIHSDGGPARYVVTKRTTVVDESGQPVTLSNIAPGRPVAVHYVREHGRLVASRIVVHAPVAAAPAREVSTTRTTTTTEAPGTITEFEPGQTVVVRGEGGAPLHYVINGQTTYVDETGAPIAVNHLAAGAPVTVHYINEGGHMVASRIVVREAAPAPRPADSHDVHEAREQLKKNYHEEKERLEHQEKRLKKAEERREDHD